MLAEKFGWTYRYILHEVAWVNIRMMLADAPHYVSDREAIPEATDDDLRDLINSF
ncbi:hypothetical protein [uncultured Rikenella sp.]|uniref:hypothetical protein n=1 Tax=uncultured Rikenella sp. TaxID=368003 RepID=UPI00272AA34A|nr:hypothetical protein [uncultured Rikenella sp.]